MPTPRGRYGQYLGLVMSSTHLEKLETIAFAEHVTLSEAVRRLIERAPLPDEKIPQAMESVAG